MCCATISKDLVGGCGWGAGHNEKALTEGRGIKDEPTGRADGVHGILLRRGRDKEETMMGKLKSVIFYHSRFPWVISG